MWTYKISTGVLTDGTKTIQCYSGRGEFKNDPSSIDRRDFGPIPVGLWNIGPAVDTASHGPVVMRLTPQDGTETFGRSGFLIHGDSIAHPGDGSEGCIVTDRQDREYINNYADKQLEVIA